MQFNSALQLLVQSSRVCHSWSPFFIRLLVTIFEAGDRTVDELEIVSLHELDIEEPP
jgi:hypothetical protein